MRKLIVIFFLVSTFVAYCLIPNQAPQIGEPLPEFALTGVKHSKNKIITKETFKGKWVLLHFWSLGCSSSVKSIMKMDTIQKQFKRDLQVVLIGRNNYKINEGIEDVYERLRANRDVDLPIVYDSLLFIEWDVSAVPQIYVVDPNGIVRFITTGFDMTTDKIMNMIDGMPVDFHPANIEYRQTNGTGLFSEELIQNDLLYSSVLTSWNGERPSIGYEFDRFVRLPEKYQNEGWSVVKTSLERLYQYAHFGKVFWFPADSAFYGKVYVKPIIEVDDYEPFEHDFISGKGTYNYYLKLPTDLITLESMQKELQKSLALNFGYKAVIETREMPVWKLIANSSARQKLKSKGGKPKFLGYNAIAGVVVRNYPIGKFLSLVSTNLPNPERLAYIDITGITEGVDCSIETDMTDFQSVQNALKKYGLELIKSTKEMKVLVIKD